MASVLLDLVKRESKRFSNAKRGNTKLQRMPLIILLVGKSGMGVSTFADMIMARAVNKSEKYFCIQDNGTETLCTPTEAESSLSSFLFCRELSGELENEGGRIKVSVIDVRGLEEDFQRQFVHFNSIIALISRRLLRYLEQSDIEYMVRAGKADEQRQDRRKVADLRIHCCLYFLEPLIAALQPRDIENLQKLQGLVNVLPVVSRADMLTIEERDLFKRNINNDLIKNGLLLYGNSLPESLPKDGEDSQLVEIFKTCSSKMPFAIISSNEIISFSSGPKIGRKHSWGNICVADESDVQALQELLLVHLTEDLRVRTIEVLYEGFRTDRLLQMKPIKADA